MKIVCPACDSINTVTLSSKDESILCLECKEYLDDPFPLDVSDEKCLLHIQENDIPLILDFHSPMCAPCVAMSDDYENASLGFGGKVRFLKIDVDNFQELARKYQVGGVPTLIAFKNAKEVNRLSKQLSQVQLSLWAQSLCEL